MDLGGSWLHGDVLMEESMGIPWGNGDIMGMSQVLWDSEFCGVIIESSFGLEHCSLISNDDRYPSAV